MSDQSVVTPPPPPADAPAKTELEARIDALEKRVAELEPEPTAADGHCWAPELEHGGQVPFYMPVDAESAPRRYIATTRGSALELHFKCCRCPATGMRKFHAPRAEGHGPHHHHHDPVETTSLPAGPCPGAKKS